MTLLYDFLNILGWLVIIGMVVGLFWIFWVLLTRPPKCRNHGIVGCGYCSYYKEDAK